MGRTFWLLIAAVLVNQFGTMAGPFMALYLREARELDPGTVASLLALGNAMGLVAGAFGGWCSDRFGRRRCLLGGFLLSAASMALLPTVAGLPLLAALVGLRSFSASFVRPSHSAAIADVVPLPLQRRAFGWFRTAMNLGFGAGTLAGGFLAAGGYVDIFIVNAVAAVAGALMLLLLPETRPAPPAAGAPDRPEAGPAVGLGRFAVFLSLAFGVSLLSSQLTNVLPVALERRGGFDVARHFGMLLAANGFFVCLFQLPISRLFERARLTTALACGAAFYGVGYGAVGHLVDPRALAGAVIVATVGEMLFFPMASAWVAQAAPEATRGRWFGALAAAYGLGSVVTPLAGGWVLVHLGDAALWALSPPIGLLAAIGFVALGRGPRPAPRPAAPEPTPRPVAAIRPS